MPVRLITLILIVFLVLVPTWGADLGSAPTPAPAQLGFSFHPDTRRLKAPRARRGGVEKWRGEGLQRCFHLLAVSEQTNLVYRIELVYPDVKNPLYFIATREEIISHGQLIHQMTLEAKLRDSGSKVRFPDFLANLIRLATEYFKEKGYPISQIRSVWSNDEGMTDNLDAFNEALLRHGAMSSDKDSAEVSEEDSAEVDESSKGAYVLAAFDTPSGRAAASAGFHYIDFILADQNPAGEHELVQVVFSVTPSPSTREDEGPDCCHHHR